MNFGETASRILRLFEPDERRTVFALLGLIVLTGLIETAGVVSIMPFLAVVVAPEAIESSRIVGGLYRILGGGDAQHFLFWLGLATIGVLAASNFVSAATSWALFRFTYHHGYRLGHRLLSGYLSQPYLFFLTHNTVDLGRNVYDEVPRVITGVVLPAMQAVSKLISSIMILTVLVVVDVTLAVILMCTFAGAYYVLYTIVQRRLTQVREIASRSRALTLRLASEALSGIKELKVLGREEHCLEAYAVPALAVADGDAKNLILGGLPKYLLETLAFGGIIIVVLFLLARDGSQVAALPVVALYAFAGYRLLPALQQFYVNVNYIQYFSPSLRLLDAHLSEAAAHRRMLGGPEVTQVLPLKHSIELDQVKFFYPAVQTPVLAGLTLRIPVNSVLGIVGTTGAGKSTALDILLGLLQPAAGEVRIDGVPLTPDRLRSWQRNIGYVPQQIYLSDGTVAGNIAFGAPREDIDMNRIVQAAKAAQLHDFIVGELADGYETVVGERGVRLSGGQRQRIGMARALYRNPAVLVLDEATSALDNLTELAIMEALRGFARQKTIILVAHRLTTLRLCDQIVLLADGKVAHQGTYDELLAKSIQFRELEAAGRSAVSRVSQG